jgi:hypothetical protein
MRSGQRAFIPGRAVRAGPFAMTTPPVERSRPHRSGVPARSQSTAQPWGRQRPSSYGSWAI